MSNHVLEDQLFQSKKHRKIIHVDMDCFYAAVECKYNPALRGKAIAIGGPPNSRSVISTCSYEARKFGVRSAMPSSHAVRLCPELILVPHQFELYKEESKAIQKIFHEFSDKVEPLSLDEAYIDVTDSTQFHGSATLIAHEIRKKIFLERKLTASAGVAPNKFLSKVASDWNKPNGLKVIRPEEVSEFILPLNVGKIHGVGKVMLKKLNEQGIQTCADLQKIDIVEMQRRFGSWGSALYSYSRGIDEREVITSWERKSVGVEETFDKDLLTFEQALQVFVGLYHDWDRRMNKGNYYLRIKNISVKIKYSDFKQKTHECAFQGIPRLEDFQNLFSKSFSRDESNLFSPLRLLGIAAKLKDEDELGVEQLSFL